MSLPLSTSMKMLNEHFPAFRYLIPDLVTMQILLEDFLTVIVICEFFGALMAKLERIDFVVT